MPTTFKAEKTGTSYRIDLSEKDTEALLDYDNNTYNASLINVLEAVNGVNNVDSDFGVHLYCSGGAHILLTISTEEDNKATWDKIFSAISKACNK